MPGHSGPPDGNEVLCGVAGAAACRDAALKALRCYRQCGDVGGAVLQQRASYSFVARLVI